MHKGSRDTDLVKKVVNANEAKIIHSLPLSKLGSYDKLFWGPSKNGIFFYQWVVLSGYPQIEKDCPRGRRDNLVTIVIH